MSSRHNGPKKYAGAVGKRKALPVLERDGEPEEGAERLTNDQVVRMLEEDGVTRIQKMMRTHDELAVDTLAQVAGDEKCSASSRVTASTRILEYAHGKPVPIISKLAAAGGGGGITINVIKFFGDGATKEEVIIEAEKVIEENT